MTTRDPLTYAWWLASRSAGIVAYLLLSLAVLIGLVLAFRAGSPRFRLGLRAIHERVALLALGGVVAHGLFLLADPWLHPGVTGVLVPFTTPYRPFWTGLGILAGYLAAGLSLTYYLRRRIGSKRWRLAHRFIPIAWAMAAVHVAGAGTDAVSLWLDVPLAVTVALIVALLAERHLARRGVPRVPAPAMATPAPEPPASPRFEREDTAAPLWSRP